MGNIFRFWNQNRRGIISFIVIIVFVIVFIQILNQIAKQRNEREKALNRNTIVLSENEQKLPTQSSIGGGSVSISETKTNVNLIEEFIEYCNNGNITEAYNMLTNECKETLFPSESDFKNGYYTLIFTQKRLDDIKQFMSANNRYTYEVTLYEDILSNGKATGGTTYKDNITIDQNSENGKLNINSFIYKENINKYSELNGVRIQVISKEVYKDNEKINVKIENNTSNEILMDTRKNANSIYIMGSNNVIYPASKFEIASSLYTIPANMSRMYKLKFNKLYSSQINTKQIGFLDIVPDNGKYQQDSRNMNERIQVVVNL